MKLKMFVLMMGFHLVSRAPPSAPLKLESLLYANMHPNGGILQGTNPSAPIGECTMFAFFKDRFKSSITHSMYLISSLDFPEMWNHSTLSSAYLHETADDCCQMFFFSWGKSCNLENVCAFTVVEETTTTSTTTGHTFATNEYTTTSTNPALNEAVISAIHHSNESPCDLHLWHPSSGIDSCTNR